METTLTSGDFGEDDVFRSGFYHMSQLQLSNNVDNSQSNDLFDGFNFENFGAMFEPSDPNSQAEDRDHPPSTDEDEDAPYEADDLSPTPPQNPDEATILLSPDFTFQLSIHSEAEYTQKRENQQQQAYAQALISFPNIAEEIQAFENDPEPTILLLIQSMKNQDSGVWDFGSQASDAIAKQEFSEYTDEAFEMLAWKLVTAAKLSQLGVRPIESQHIPVGSKKPRSKGKFEKFETFQDRIQAMAKSFHLSKALCKQALDNDYYQRVVDAPAAELKQKKSNKKLNEKRDSQIKAGRLASGMQSSPAKSSVKATKQSPAKLPARSVSSGKRKSSAGDDVGDEDEETPVKRPRKRAPAKSRAKPEAEAAVVEKEPVKTATVMNAGFNSPDLFGTVAQARMTYPPNALPIPAQTLRSNAPPLPRPIPSYGENPYLSGTFSPYVPSVGAVNQSTYDGHKFNRPPPRQHSYNAAYPVMPPQQEQFGPLQPEEANLIYVQHFNRSNDYPKGSYFPQQD